MLLPRRMVYHLAVNPPIPGAAVLLNFDPNAVSLAATVAAPFAPEVAAPLEIIATMMNKVPPEFRQKIYTHHDMFVQKVGDKLNIPEEYRVDMNKHRQTQHNVISTINGFAGWAKKTGVMDSFKRQAPMPVPA